jgi:hypothetical protein
MSAGERDYEPFEMLSVVRLTETQIDRGVRCNVKHVPYFLVPISRKAAFWKSQCWTDMQEVGASVFFY